MGFKNAILIFTYYTLFNTFAWSQVPERKGWWKFDNPVDLIAPEPGYGTALLLNGTQTAASGPEDGNGAVLIGPGSYYKMNHGITANGGGSFVNEYSLQFDFKIPQTGIWHAFFQTSVSNNNDGDFFINPSGNIGVAAVGYGNYAVHPDEWYRLLVTVKNGTSFTFYIDGNLILKGTTQAIDGRFALADQLLVFADENAEDGAIICSELSIWDKALTAEQALELGGYKHTITNFLMTRIPYLQGATTNTVNICWHDTAVNGTRVDFGTDSTLTTTKPGTSELISSPYRWHTVKLTGLTPNTRYFYKIFSGNDSSSVFSFKTQPDTGYKGLIRYVLFSDTHSPDTTSAEKTLRAARAKISELYGPDVENHINGVLHSGDITMSGNIPEQYSSQYFKPLSNLSANIPVTVVAGNHEGESGLFYSYLKLDELSAYPLNPALNEKIWSMRTGNTLFIGLNTNIIDQYGNLEASWLDTKLNEAENDASIDFVFLFFHHPPYSELWFDVLLLDNGPFYVENVIFPIIKKYTKVQEIHNGHTHGFERGTILSPGKNADFRTIIGGGGGGALDNWGSFANYDYNDTYIAYDHFCFQILEIDIANHSWQNTMYSLGTPNKPRDSEPLDNWYRKVSQPGPETPVAENADVASDFIRLYTSPFSGVDSLMTVQLQLIDSSANPVIVVDSLVNWKNIYGVDKDFNPIDKNAGIDLTRIKIPSSNITFNKSYFFRVRYRDHNLKWSNWSNMFPFSTVGINTLKSSESFLLQNFPNPFKSSTVFSYNLPEKSTVRFQIYDSSSVLIDSIDEGQKAGGHHQLSYKGENLKSGVYFYKIVTNCFSMTRKMVKI